MRCEEQWRNIWPRMVDNDDDAFFFRRFRVPCVWLLGFYPPGLTVCVVSFSSVLCDLPRSCRIIMSCESSVKVIDPLRSRCLLIRIPAPTVPEVRVSLCASIFL